MQIELNWSWGPCDQIRFRCAPISPKNKWKATQPQTGKRTINAQNKSICLEPLQCSSLAALLSAVRWMIKQVITTPQNKGGQTHLVFAAGTFGLCLFSSSPGIQFVRHNSHKLSRIYPSGQRLQSSNYNPQDMWNGGSQLGERSAYPKGSSRIACHWLLCVFPSCLELPDARWADGPEPGSLPAKRSVWLHPEAPVHVPVFNHHLQPGERWWRFGPQTRLTQHSGNSTVGTAEHWRARTNLQHAWTSLMRLLTAMSRLFHRKKAHTLSSLCTAECASPA